MVASWLRRGTPGLLQSAANWRPWHITILHHLQNAPVFSLHRIWNRESCRLLCASHSDANIKSQTNLQSCSRAAKHEALVDASVCTTRFMPPYLATKDVETSSKGGDWWNHCSAIRQIRQSPLLLVSKQRHLRLDAVRYRPNRRPILALLHTGSCANVSPKPNTSTPLQFKLLSLVNRS